MKSIYLSPGIYTFESDFSIKRTPKQWRRMIRIKKILGKSN